MNNMAFRKHSINFSHPFISRITAGVQFAVAYSVYSPIVSLKELTSAQGLMLSLFYSLLQADIASVFTLISLADQFPQLRSSFISVWLRDDYMFCQEHVAKVLITLARLMTEEQLIVPQPIVNALVGLEEKYDIFNFFHQSRDTTAQYLLACLNPLVTRATQAGPESFHEQGIQAKPVMEAVATQTSTEDSSIEAESSRRNCKCKSTSSEDETSLSSIEELSDSSTPSPEPENGIELTASSESEASTSARFIAERNLLAAVRNNDFAKASQALAAGARPDCCDRWYWTPLHLAAERGYCRMLRLLLAAGATVDSTTVANATALHHAASAGHLECSLKLLNSGANPNARNQWGLTPIHKALERRHVAVANLIKSRGGL